MKETILKTTCPLCHETLRVRKPATMGKHPYRCPKCQGVFALDVKPESGTVMETETDASVETYEVQQMKGCLLTLCRKRSFRSDVRYELHEGVNIIGAESDSAPSDIMLSDEYVSRRSVSIRLEPMPQGTYKYEFTLLRTTNPAYFNDEPITVGTSLYMKAGDSFQIGKTTFHMVSSK